MQGKFKEAGIPPQNQISCLFLNKKRYACTGKSSAEQESRSGAAAFIKVSTYKNRPLQRIMEKEVIPVWGKEILLSPKAEEEVL